jgi:hypothetical protein
MCLLSFRHNASVHMKAKANKSDLKVLPQSRERDDNPQEYPSYLSEEDIYSKFKKEDINPEDTSKLKNSEKKRITGQSDENSFDDYESGIDLDVPGSELDDEQELIGGEDEENNYYSLGGDDHNDLDEDKDELL